MTTPAVAAGPTPALMKEINAAFNDRDVERIMTFFAEDATFLMARGPEPDGRRVRGKAAIRKVLADRFTIITDMRCAQPDGSTAGHSQRMQDADGVSDVQSLSVPAGRRRARVDVQPSCVVLRSQRVHRIRGHGRRRRHIG